MSAAIATITAFYDYTLQPIPALTWVGAPISALDIAGALRLALILRQLRELFHREHLAKLSSTSVRVKNGRLEKDPVPVLPPLEKRSRIRDFATNLVIVFGGEAVIGTFKNMLFCTSTLGLTTVRFFLVTLRFSHFYSPVARLATHFLRFRRCTPVVSEHQRAG